MPFYDYSCLNCGDFRKLRPLAESSMSQFCPICNETAEKNFVAPFILSKKSQQKSSKPNVLSCGHGPGCSHGRFAWPKS